MVYVLTSETSHACRSTISECSPVLLIVRARPCRTDLTHVIAVTTTRHVTCLPKRLSSLGLDFACHTTPPSHLFSYRHHRSISFPLNILLLQVPVVALQSQPPSPSRSPSDLSADATNAHCLENRQRNTSRTASSTPRRWGCWAETYLRHGPKLL